MKAIITYKGDLMEDTFSNVSSTKEIIKKAVEKIKLLKPNITFPTRVVTTIEDKYGNSGTFIETINNYVEFIDDIEFIQEVSNKEMFAVIDRRFGELDAIFSCLEKAENWIKQLQENLFQNPNDYYIDSADIDPNFKEYFDL